MKNRSILLLQTLLWVVAAMHLVVGGGFNVIPGFARYMADVYGRRSNGRPNLATSSAHSARS